MKIGIRVEITQVTDDIVHSLFQIYDIVEMDNKQYPNKTKEFLEKIKLSSLQLVTGETK